MYACVGMEKKQKNVHQLNTLLDHASYSCPTFEVTTKHIFVACVM